MNDDIFKGQWKQIKGVAKQAWGELTDDDLVKVGGSAERMVGVLQEKYGWAKDRAERELSQVVDRLRNDDKPQSESARGRR